MSRSDLVMCHHFPGGKPQMIDDDDLDRQ